MFLYWTKSLVLVRFCSVTSTFPSDVLVVVPAYNEEQTIEDVLAAVLAAGAVKDQVVVVDDGSTDGTAHLVKKVGVVLLSHSFNCGVGAAMRTGFTYAYRNGFSYVVQLDADGQHDPAHVADLRAVLGSVDVVVGTRFSPKGSRQYSASFVRRVAMRFLAFVVSFFTSTRLTDVTSGFRGAGPDAVRLFKDHYPTEYLADTVDSLILAHRCGLELAQIEVAMYPRAGGVPSQGFVSSVLYLLRAVSALLLGITKATPDFVKVR